MPSSQDPSSQKQASLVFTGSSYDRILAAFYKNANDQSVQGRNGRVHVALKTAESYDSALHNLASGSYAEVAGADLSSVLMPFETNIGSNKMPAFDPNASPSGAASGLAPNLADLLPVQWNSSDTSNLVYRWSSPSGDSIPNMISGDEYYGNIDAIRSNSSMRGVGLRLPIMAVGWGYTTDAKPWPSGNWNNIQSQGFKAGNGLSGKGWMVDQSDYVSAPIDLRYDRRNNVWTSPKGFWAQILASGNGGAYSWKEQIVSSSGTLTDPPSSAPWVRKGSITQNPAYEVNRRDVPSGTNVWIQAPERNHNLQFVYGSVGGVKVFTASGTMPSVDYLYIDPLRNTDSIMELIAGPSGTNGKIGAGLALKAGPGSYSILSTIGGNIVWDYVRVSNV